MSAYTEEKDSSKLSNSNKLNEIIGLKSNESKQWISFEFFPPKTTEGLAALYNALNELKLYNPLFIDVTWGAGGSTSDLTIEICSNIVNKYNLTTNMHLTCTNMEKSLIDKALNDCRSLGINNILALRGDPPIGQEVWTSTEEGLTCALDLVNYININYSSNDFCISVSGYPEGHPSSIIKFDSLESMSRSEFDRHSCEIDDDGNISYYSCPDKSFNNELKYLKLKIDAGSKFIITQMFFDFKLYVSFVKACRDIGIDVPIIPGIMCISNYSGFKRMIKFCKTKVNNDMLKTIESIKDNTESIKQYGIEFGVELCKQLIDYGAPGLHFYTLNSSSSTISILEKLGYQQNVDSKSTVVAF